MSNLFELMQAMMRKTSEPQPQPKYPMLIFNQRTFDWLDRQDRIIYEGNRDIIWWFDQFGYLRKAYAVVARPLLNSMSRYTEANINMEEIE